MVTVGIENRSVLPGAATGGSGLIIKGHEGTTGVCRDVFYLDCDATYVKVCVHKE